MQAIACQGDTVDLICQRNYGHTAGAVEAVLAANPGLAALGLILPQGTAVMLPDLPPPPTANLIQLWT